MLVFRGNPTTPFLAAREGNSCRHVLVMTGPQYDHGERTSNDTCSGSTAQIVCCPFVRCERVQKTNRAGFGEAFGTEAVKRPRKTDDRTLDDTLGCDTKKARLDRDMCVKPGIDLTQVTMAWSGKFPSLNWGTRELNKLCHTLMHCGDSRKKAWTAATAGGEKPLDTYMSEMRYDTTFTTRGVMRDTWNSTAGSLQKIKQNARYVKGRPRRVFARRPVLIDISRKQIEMGGEGSVGQSQLSCCWTRVVAHNRAHEYNAFLLGARRLSTCDHQDKRFYLTVHGGDSTVVASQKQIKWVGEGRSHFIR